MASSLVEADPYSRPLPEIPTPDVRPWSEKIKPRSQIRNNLIATHRQTHEIPKDDWWDFGTSFKGQIHRRVFEEANVGWPVTDLLWGGKFPEGIPEDEARKAIIVDVKAASVVISSQDASVGLNMNTFPEVFIVRPRRASNLHLFHEAKVYIEQGERVYDPGYETRAPRGNIFDNDVILNHARAAEQILDVVRLIKFTLSQ